MIKKNKIKKDKIQKVVYKTTNVLLTIIVIIAIISLLTLVIQKIIFKNEMPNIFGFKILQVMSGSMSGTFETGDLILVKKITNESDLNIGDIITFKVNESLVTHRIIDITKNNGKLEFTTKGDANNVKDIDKVEFNNIEGKFLFKISNSSIFLQPAIIAGCKFVLKSNSIPKSKASLIDLCSLFLINLKASLKREIEKF